MIPRKGASTFAVVLAFSMAALLAGCATKPAQPEPPPPPVTSPRDELLKTDRAFATLAAQKGTAEAFHSFATPDVVMLPMGDLPVKGREQMRSRMAEDKEGRLVWNPVAVEVSESGDLGYTWGNYEYHGKSAEGEPIVRSGKYVTLWRRQPDGSWRFFLDISNPNPATK